MKNMILGTWDWKDFHCVDTTNKTTSISTSGNNKILTNGPPTKGAKMPPNLDIIDDVPTAKCPMGVGKSLVI